MGFFRRRSDPQAAVGPEPLVKVGPVSVWAEDTEPHPLRSQNYEPVFPRTSVTRRVLAHITPEVDRTDLGPRNTLPALTAGLISDDHTEIAHPEQVQPYLDALVAAGLVSEHAGTYQVTDAGWRELMN